MNMSRGGKNGGTRKHLITTFGVLNEKALDIVDEVKKVAQEIKKPAALVALAWLRSKPAVTSILLGASNSEQLKANLEEEGAGLHLASFAAFSALHSQTVSGKAVIHQGRVSIASVFQRSL